VTAVFAYDPDSPTVGNSVAAAGHAVGSDRPETTASETVPSSSSPSESTPGSASSVGTKSNIAASVDNVERESHTADADSDSDSGETGYGFPDDSDSHAPWL
jgi:hypothetical protein